MYHATLWHLQLNTAVIKSVYITDYTVCTLCVCCAGCLCERINMHNTPLEVAYWVPFMCCIGYDYYNCKIMLLLFWQWCCIAWWDWADCPLVTYIHCQYAGMFYNRSLIILVGWHLHDGTYVHSIDKPYCGYCIHSIQGRGNGVAVPFQVIVTKSACSNVCQHTLL
jgi:hypothetical protein